MVNEIKEKYRNFHDGVIFGFEYFPNSALLKPGALKTAIVVIQPLNYQTQAVEIVKLIFADVLKFKFYEDKKICSSVVFEAYIEQLADMVIFDFLHCRLMGH